MASSVAGNELKTKTLGITRVGVLVICVLHSLEVSLTRVYTENLLRLKNVQESADTLPFRWTPVHWLGAGQLCGCLLGGVVLHYCGRKSSLHFVALPLLLVGSSLSSYLPDLTLEWDSPLEKLWAFAFATALFLQGCGETISRIGIPIYVLETVCEKPGSFDSRCSASLLLASQLPSPLASLLVSTVNSKWIRIVPLCILGLLLVLYFLLPESPVWLVIHKKRLDKAKSALRRLRRRRTHSRELLRIQKYAEGDESWLRPLLVSCGVLLLSQYTGRDIYEFYQNWAFRVLGLKWSGNVVCSSLSLFSVSLITLGSFVYRGPPIVTKTIVITTVVVTTCLLGMGSLMHMLEQGSTSLPWVPLTLVLLHNFAYSAGIGSLAWVIACTVSPTRYRVSVLSISVLLYSFVSNLNYQVLPLLFNVLHPFGVFWLHASLSAIGLVYLAMVVSPELRYVAKNIEIDENFQELQLTAMSHRQSTL